MLCLAVNKELKSGRVGFSLQRAEQALQISLRDVIRKGFGKIEVMGHIQSPGPGEASSLLHHLKAEDVAGSKAATSEVGQIPGD